jgi:hypothetical protein
MARKGWSANNGVVKCRDRGCFSHVVHTGDVLVYREGSAVVLKIRDDGLKVVFVGRMNKPKTRLKTGTVWRFRKKNVCVMPLPKTFNTVEEWLDSLHE